MFDAFKNIAIVPARDGSKGYPGKNFKTFYKKPLFLHAIDQALEHVIAAYFHQII